MWVPCSKFGVICRGSTSVLQTLYIVSDTRVIFRPDLNKMKFGMVQFSLINTIQDWYPFLFSWQCNYCRNVISGYAEALCIQGYCFVCIQFHNLNMVYCIKCLWNKVLWMGCLEFLSAWLLFIMGMYFCYYVNTY